MVIIKLVIIFVIATCVYKFQLETLITCRSVLHNEIDCVIVCSKLLLTDG